MNSEFSALFSHSPAFDTTSIYLNTTMLNACDSNFECMPVAFVIAARRILLYIPFFFSVIFMSFE